MLQSCNDANIRVEIALLINRFNVVITLHEEMVHKLKEKLDIGIS